MDVWVLGRIGYDLYAREPGRPLGEVRTFSRHLGGSSANIAVGLARLGLAAGIISAIGDDALAPYLLDFLREEGVETRFVKRVSGYQTSLCLTEVRPPDHFHQVFYRARPADSQITAGPEELKAVRSAKMFITNGTNLAAPPAREAARAALEAARQGGAQTVLDIDYRASSWSGPAEAGKMARETLRWVDVVLGNEEELALLTGRENGPEQVLAVLHAGPKILVRKLGARGVEARTAETRHFAESSSREVVCAIGGGDGFAAGFLYALYRGMDLPRALAYGNAAAAVVVSRVSCSDAMPRLSEIEAQLQGSTAAR